MGGGEGGEGGDGRLRGRFERLFIFGEGPVGRFEGLRVLKQVADYPARHASTMVALEAVLDAVNQAQELALAKHHSDTRTRLAGAA